MIPLEQGSVFRRIISRCNLNLSRVSIPLEQGSVFRRESVDDWLWAYAVSIPLEQGSVFRPSKPIRRNQQAVCLNPFGTGQCLPTAVVF